jgi:soluble lytic murein transglycosylase-like protein
MGGIYRILTGFQTVIALALLLAASDSIAANSAVYAYRGSDGSWLFTDHAQKNRKYQLVRKKKQARGAAARTSGPFYRGDPSAYDRLIRKMARLYNIDAALIKAVMHAESAFNPHATSHKGATGLMQLMPSTARQYGVYDLYDPVQNIQAAVRYLSDLMDRYRENTTLVLAAYNAGENAVDQHRGVPPYKETQNYVRKVLRFKKLYAKEFN